MTSLAELLKDYESDPERSVERATGIALIGKYHATDSVAKEFIRERIEAIDELHDYEKQALLVALFFIAVDDDSFFESFEYVVQHVEKTPLGFCIMTEATVAAISDAEDNSDVFPLVHRLICKLRDGIELRTRSLQIIERAYNKTLV